MELLYNKLLTNYSEELMNDWEILVAEDVREQPKIQQFIELVYQSNFLSENQIIVIIELFYCLLASIYPNQTFVRSMSSDIGQLLIPIEYSDKLIIEVDHQNAIYEMLTTYSGSSTDKIMVGAKLMNLVREII